MLLISMVVSEISSYFLFYLSCNFETLMEVRKLPSGSMFSFTLLDLLNIYLNILGIFYVNKVCSYGAGWERRTASKSREHWC